jgi:hypothetical protein
LDPWPRAPAGRPAGLNASVALEGQWEILVHMFCSQARLHALFFSPLVTRESFGLWFFKKKKKKGLGAFGDATRAVTW